MTKTGAYSCYVAEEMLGVELMTSWSTAKRR